MKLYALLLPVLLLTCCSGTSQPSGTANATVESFTSGSATVQHGGTLNVPLVPTVDIRFSQKVELAKLREGSIYLNGIKFTVAQSDEYTLRLTVGETLRSLSKYRLTIYDGETLGVKLIDTYYCTLATGVDETPKFPVISDEELLTLTQKQTFKYFWEGGHPTSGMARERMTSGDIVTTGGTGFGIMAMVVAAERGFVSRADAAARVQKIVTFLDTKCTNYHGAYAHWLNGATGATVPFSTYDNGGDLVETAFLFEGLLTARAYFSDNAQLVADITRLWENVDWTWYQRGGENKLYWHWSPTYGWQMNMPIRGWNECLIVYILAASSPTHPISKDVYTQGWAQSMANGNKYYDVTLPLGPSYGGPMFWSHYSFLGLDPHGLSDAYANYWTQTTAHARINYAYCVANPKKYPYYGANCWGLTASDCKDGYDAFSPTNDRGVIAPTAALASMPYTPTESMAALKFFYYTIGDRLWSDWGFRDAFDISAGWFDSDWLAIDQGPIVVMIENHRTGLVWHTFMSIAEIRNGLTRLGFTID